MRTVSRTSRSSAGVVAAIGTAVAGAILALFTGLGQGIGHATDGADTVSTSSVSAPADGGE